MRILIVEDEKLLVWSLQQALTRPGDEVMAEHTGEEALVRLRQMTFDWVITDYRLPGISGLEVLRQTKNLQPQVQIIVISAYGSPQLLEEMERSGASHFLAKPFSIAELIRLIHPATDGMNPTSSRSTTHSFLKRDS